ncbi:hypothetical protein V9K67_26325 [Paraflavisolibacter sp. H34]|uniref:hypothetical protein n=1 Tax=Huijunlia imazamoxiresistens TaxID=3127457 RepID=UPI003015DDD1
MYPDFQYWMERLFESDMLHWLGFIKTLGFIMGMAFLVASWLFIYFAGHRLKIQSDISHIRNFLDTDTGLRFRFQVELGF